MDDETIGTKIRLSLLLREQLRKKYPLFGYPTIFQRVINQTEPKPTDPPCEWGVKFTNPQTLDPQKLAPQNLEFLHHQPR